MNNLHRELAPISDAAWAQIEEETKKHAATQQQLGGRLAELQTEIDQTRPLRDTAASEVPAKAREMFERLADRYEGEALAPISRPKPRREEYVCTACNMELVVDLYNRLHTRDEVVYCPSCRRMLFIPDDLPPELATFGAGVVAVDYPLFESGGGKSRVPRDGKK